MSRFTVNVFVLSALFTIGCTKKAEKVEPPAPVQPEASAPAPEAPAAATEATDEARDEKERAAIIQVLTSRFSGVQACIEEFPVEERPGEASIDVTFRVNTEGRAEDVDVQSASKVAVECFTNWIEAIEFPAPSKPITINFPYQFE